MNDLETKLQLLKLHPTYTRLYDIMILLQELNNDKYLFKDYECSLDEEFINNICDIKSKPHHSNKTTNSNANKDIISKRLQELLPASIFKQVVYEKDQLDTRSQHSSGEEDYDNISISSNDTNNLDLDLDVDKSVVDCCSVGKKAEDEVDVEVEVDPDLEVEVEVEVDPDQDPDLEFEVEEGAVDDDVLSDFSD